MEGLSPQDVHQLDKWLQAYEVLFNNSVDEEVEKMTHGFTNVVESKVKKEIEVTEMASVDYEFRYVGSSVSGYPKIEVKRSDSDTWREVLKIRPEGIVRYKLPKGYGLPTDANGRLRISV